MTTDIKQIAPFVKKQFPAFYETDGDNFLQFVQAYYEWLDETSVGTGRNLFEIDDIDTTSQQYIDYFLHKYMYGIPATLLSDKRLLEKHILDVYRSKGSIEGLKLLFRLLYNTDIDVYIPSVDMLKPSDGTWVRRKYLEVYNTPKHYQYHNQLIRGISSGATAFVSTASVLYLTNKVVHVLYITDDTLGPTGSTFRIGERVVYDGLDIKEATWIKGSPVGAYVAGSSEHNVAGDPIYTTDPAQTGQGVQFLVSELIDPQFQRGFVTFNLRNGGYGYTLNSNISITYKSATNGVGANFKIGSLSNTSVFTYNTQFIAPEVSTPLSGTFSANLNFAGLNTVLDDALLYANVVVGTIETLTAQTSGNKLYNGSLNVDVFEQITYGYGIVDPAGNFWGHDSLITGDYLNGNGQIRNVSLLSSGYGYNTENEQLEFTNQSNTNLTSELFLHLGGVGYEEGEWTTTKSFLNSDKYIQDSYYYQEYSYEIQIAKSLDKYVSVLKQVMHPVGNRVFGKPVFSDNANSHGTFIATEEVTQLLL